MTVDQFVQVVALFGILGVLTAGFFVACCLLFWGVEAVVDKLKARSDNKSGPSVPNERAVQTYPHQPDQVTTVLPRVPNHRRPR